MIVKKKIASVPTFVAGDATKLQEIFHPEREGLPVRYSLARAILEPEQSSYPHCLDGRSELYVFLEGEGRAVIGKEEVAVKAGDLVWVPPGESQYVINTGVSPLVFLCIVDPAWTAESERLL
jgi:mannose-6-phosphate isomerase-like protein (cupin superfamily)